MTHPDAQRAFEEYWTEDGRNLCKSPLDSVEARMHKRTWDAATERAAKIADEKAERINSRWIAHDIANAIRGVK
jgi:hypothetical protein